MLGTIIQREIQEYLKSKRLWLGLFIALLLITVSTLINIGEYQRLNTEYQDAIRNVKRISEIPIFRPPQILSILVQGESDQLGYRFGLTDRAIPVRALDGSYSETEDIGDVSGFEAFDFAFTVKAVLSLLVIFLASGAVSEEKSSGTLRLMLSNSIPRHVLITGKCIGGMGIVLSALLVSWTVSLLLIMFHPAVAINSDFLFRTLCILGISILFLSVFYFLGVFISVIVTRPSIALMILLQIWIFLVVLYPNAAILAAQHAVQLPSERIVAEQKQEIIDRYRNMPDMRYTEAEQVYRINQNFDMRLRQQVRVSEILGGMSPASLFSSASIRLAQTGTAEYDRFTEGIYQYWQENMKRGRVSSSILNEENETPAFHYQTESFSRSLEGIAWDAAILFLWGILFFALSVFSFLRKDVR